MLAPTILMPLRSVALSATGSNDIYLDCARIARRGEVNCQKGKRSHSGVHPGLTPQGGQHGDDLLFTAHYTGQEQGVFSGHYTKGLLDDLAVT